MIGDEVESVLSRSGLTLKSETIEELCRASAIVRRLAQIVARDSPMEAEPAFVFRVEPGE